VVDNASTDATASLDRHHPAVRVLRQPVNRGFAGGVNAGIRVARHETIVVLNNDTAAAPNLLQELHAGLETDARIGAVAPVSNHVKGPAQIPLGAQGRDAAARTAIAAALQASRPTRLQDVDTLAGLCLMVRRATLDQAGLFDERFGHGNFEDDDLCLRLRLLGYRLVIVRTAFLHHEGHATFRAMGLELREQLAQRRAQFVAKWRHDPAGRATVAAMHGDLAGAAAAAVAARVQWPLWPDADWHLGRWLAATSDAAGACRHFAALLRACPHHSEAAIELGLQRLARGDAEGAGRHLEWTVANCHLTTPSQLRLLRQLGERAHARQDWREAVAHFRSALDLAPTDGALHNWLGLGLLGAGELDRAEAAFGDAVAHGFPLALTNLGICHQQRGEFDRAVDDFARAVELVPHDPVARSNHAAMQQVRREVVLGRSPQ
jgi:GT2 family glycosyltransferase/Tfp pilus assembly protein PilF